jgi:hypothetical protein
MSSYILESMNDGRRKFVKNYPNGVNINNYPQKPDSRIEYFPHIYIPIELMNDRKMQFIKGECDMNCSYTRDKGYMVYFKRVKCMNLRDSLLEMELLKPIAQHINKIK